DPFVTVFGPGSFTKAAACVEMPGPNPLSFRVPADPLGAAAEIEILKHGCVRRNDEGLVLRPLERYPGNFAFFGFVGPFPHDPLQRVQVFLIGGWRVRRVADAAHRPSTIFFDVDYRVPSPARRSAARRSHRSRPV